MARGKVTLTTDDKKLISDAISTFTNLLLPDSVKVEVAASVSEVTSLRSKLPDIKDQDYLDTKRRIVELSEAIIGLTEPYTGIDKSTLEASILSFSLKNEFPGSMTDNTFDKLDERMRLYMTHNQSFLTDTKFLGFPFHYFYTAVFLLILFISLCIVYNLLIEWRLKKQGVVES